MHKSEICFVDASVSNVDDSSKTKRWIEKNKEQDVGHEMYFYELPTECSIKHRCCRKISEIYLTDDADFSSITNRLQKFRFDGSLSEIWTILKIDLIGQ